ncbi:hypothetical protein BLS_004158 [Venturia inaequalis]|uniref:Glycosylphosphatidylinositol anchor biosynthesis protein 11 n=1 Tax=Venturia inaequalis TaxID=5025 RepID=A0A8H3Z2K1_VENIN|nr:hypothetical protein BLS_004158 [Venturia inaequalis]KAE9980873.1 hypothetical protein EG328_012009 [Venturia inaequalis]KAE9993242.1 hypothetical protein EG327_005849 [Venturia inaequalis]RDI88015.1 hypothetical protein Vi05172_g2061 [Venturia inaequalis]
MSSTAPVQKTEKPRALPIKHLDNDTAKLYTHIHPALVLSSYIFSFQSIVANPVRSLYILLLPLSILQVAYVVLCLPPAGTTSPASNQKLAEKKVFGGKKKAANWSSKIVPSLISLILSTTFGTPILTIILVLFGAPLTTHLAHTLLCAAHLALLSGLPLIYTHGVETEKWKEIARLAVPVDEVFGAALGACVGAWLGAVPIPLDWDREWQKWPVTILTGAYIGWAVGKALGGLVLRGKIVDLGP